ncbi:hypothetical protein ECZU34_64150 [Escherichia coli]|nr:hypothetical protein ECZU34_64150 [Escherichia coli]
MAETESLKQYACRHFAERLPAMARNGELKSCLAVHRTLAEAGLWMGIQHGHLVLHDGFDKQQTPVRADSVWPLMTLDYMGSGWWMAACTEGYFYSGYTRRTIPGT